jgi:hypothetical protein
MRIAILGWGSLIWDTGDLPLETDWIQGGPVVPIEFSRISHSRNGALTLVIDPINGTPIRSRYALSQRTNLNDAIGDLQTRESTIWTYIGYVNLKKNTQRCVAYPGAADVIRRWAQDNNLDAVVWTDLPSNFLEKENKDFTVSVAIKYLKRLPGSGASKAREYINKAPQDVVTPLREALENDPWMKEQ